MTGVPVTNRQRLIALKIVEMLKEECKTDLLDAVKALALANQMFQQAFASTVNRFARLQTPPHSGDSGGKKVGG